MSILDMLDITQQLELHQVLQLILEMWGTYKDRTTPLRIQITDLPWLA